MCYVKSKTNLFEFKLVGGNKMSVTIGNKNVIKCSTINGNIYQDCQEAIVDRRIGAYQDCQGIISDKNIIMINGIEIPLPSATEERRNISIINDKVFVDGYEWKNGKWQKTLRALYHKYF